MKFHLCEEHAATTEVHTTFRCELCEQMFNSQQELLQHQQSSHGQRSQKSRIKRLF